MKTKVVLLIFLSLVIKGFTQIPQSPNKINSNGNKEGVWTILFTEKWKETTIPDSIKYYRLITFQDGKPSGIVRDYYLSGKIQWEGKLKSMTPEDVHDDSLCTWYNENGKTSSQGNYKNEVRDGFWKEYEDDDSWWEGNYINGKKDGIWTGWYENGKKIGEHLWVDGKREGLWSYWFDDGNLSSQGKYKNGLKEGLWKEYEEDGSWWEGNYITGKEDGNWTGWYNNGKKKENTYG